MALRSGSSVKWKDLLRFAFGRVQDYADRYTNFSTTNTSFTSVAAGSIVPGMEVTVVGTGQPVDIFFQTCFRHTVFSSSAFVGAYLITSVDGGADSTTPKRATLARNNVSAAAELSSLTANWLNVPTEKGKTYTFKVGAYGTAGTTTFDTVSGVYPIQMNVRNH